MNTPMDSNCICGLIGKLTPQTLAQMLVDLDGDEKETECIKRIMLDVFNGNIDRIKMEYERYAQLPNW